MTTKKSDGLVIDILAHEMNNNLGHWLSHREKYKHIIEKVRAKNRAKYLAARKEKMAKDAFDSAEVRETDGKWTTGSGDPATEKQIARAKAKQAARAKGSSLAPPSKMAATPNSAPTPAKSMK